MKNGRTRGDRGDRSDDKTGVEDRRRPRWVTMGGEAGRDPEEINQRAPRVWPLPGQRGDSRDQ